MGRRGGTGDSARPATHGSANRGAGQAPDRYCHDTPDGRADAGTGRAARHDARAGIGVPATIVLIIAAVVGRVGDPADMLIAAVGVVPITVVIGDGRGFAIGVHVMHPPALAIRIAGDIASAFSLGAGCQGHHRARKCEQRAQTECSVKLFHREPFKAANRIRQLSVR